MLRGQTTNNLTEESNDHVTNDIVGRALAAKFISSIPMANRSASRTNQRVTSNPLRELVILVRT